MKRKETKTKVFIRTNRYCLYSVNMFCLSAIIFVSLIVRVVFEWKFCLHHSHDSCIISIIFSLTLGEALDDLCIFFISHWEKNHVFGFNQNKQKKVEKNFNVSGNWSENKMMQFWSSSKLNVFQVIKHQDFLSIDICLQF